MSFFGEIILVLLVGAVLFALILYAIFKSAESSGQAQRAQEEEEVKKEIHRKEKLLTIDSL